MPLDAIVTKIKIAKIFRERDTPTHHAFSCRPDSRRTGPIASQCPQTTPGWWRDISWVDSQTVAV
jgi:hypothetical protein